MSSPQTDVYFIIDHSGSMGSPAKKSVNNDANPISKMYLVQIILQYLLTQFFNMQNIKVNLIFFSTNSNVYECLTLEESINKVYSVEADGTTNMKSAILDLGQNIAYSIINNRNYIAFILTDGEFDAYSFEIADILTAKIKSLTNNKPIEKLNINVVSIGEDSNIDVLKKITNTFNGNLAFIAGENTIQSVFSSFIIDKFLKFSNNQETKPYIDVSILTTIIRYINNSDLSKAKQEFTTWMKNNPEHQFITCIDPNTNKNEANEILNSLNHNSSWRLHYLYSLQNNHVNQLYGNHLSPSLLPYYNGAFKQMYDEWKNAFLLLEIKPDPEIIKRKVMQEIEAQRQRGIQVNQQQVRQNVVSSVRAPQSQSFVDPYGGCFSIDSFVETENETLPEGPSSTLPEGPSSTLRAGDIRKGMKLKNKSTVLWILRTNNASNLCIIDSSLIITNTHPVKENGIWKQAQLVENSIPLSKQFDVVSFVLDKCDSITVDGYQVASLGHNSKEEGLSHPFYSSKVIDYILELSKNQPESSETGIVISDPTLFKQHYEACFN